MQATGKKENSDAVNPRANHVRLGVTTLLAWLIAAGACFGEAMVLSETDGVVVASSVRMDEQGQLVAVVQGAAEPKRIAAGKVVLVQQDLLPVFPEPRAWLVFADGRRLSGELVKPGDESFVLQSSRWGEVRAKASDLAAVFLRSGQPKVAHGGGGVVRILALTGDVMAAPSVAVQADKLIAELDSGDVELAWARVGGIVWGRAAEAGTAGAEDVLLDLRGGDQVLGRIQQWDERQIKLRDEAPVPVREVHRIWFGRARPTYLSDLKPIDSKYESKFDRRFACRVDRNVDGAPLRIGSKWYSRGVGTRSRSSIRYDLQRKYRWFMTEVGIDEAAAQYGAATVSLEVDGKQIWRQDIKARAEAKLVAVPVAGAAQLTLVADFGADSQDLGDYVDWADAILVE